MQTSGAGLTRQFVKFQAQKEASTDRAQGDEFGKGGREKSVESCTGHSQACDSNCTGMPLNGFKQGTSLTFTNLSGTC